MDLSLEYLLGELGFFYYTQGRYKEAVSAERRALEVSEAALPVGHPTIAVRLDNLAGTLVTLGRTEEALPLQRRAAQIRAGVQPGGALPEGERSAGDDGETTPPH